MRFLVLLLAAAFCDARPSDQMARASFTGVGTQSYILGGVEAEPNSWPWQLSQERLGGSWSHSCGASLLRIDRALSAAHCVQGAADNILRVWAGLHVRNDNSQAQLSNLSGKTIHQQYNQGAETFNNDIAILNLATAIDLSDSRVGLLTLPPNNEEQFAGQTCVITGWGRDGAPNTLPNALRQVDIQVIAQLECNSRMSPVSGALTGPGQICLYDTAASAGSCNGDSGGPLNCQLGGQTVVAGVTSWGIQGGGQCLPSYPSVYSRTSFFLQWIADNQ